MKKIINYIVEIIKEDYISFLILIALLVIFNIPLNYYITIGGGTSDVSSRIDVQGKHKSKGSFNISYVTQLDGTVFSFLASFIMPNWERENANSYKYVNTESIDDIDFRSNLDLKSANGNATYWAYTLAGYDIKETSAKLYVISVDKDTFKSNLKIKDEILSVDGVHCDSVYEYQQFIQTLTDKDEVEVEIIRNKKKQTIKTNLNRYEDKILLGVLLQYVREYDTDPPVNIKFKKSESGPSGGLITTLEIYNQLTKKDLTKGYKIVGTGTIEADGTIGQIGGIEHKILGAVSDKADYFLVPAGKNYTAARKYIKKKNLKLKLIKVKNIEEAIKKLEELG